MKKFSLLIICLLFIEISCSVQSTELSEEQKIAIVAEVKDCIDGKISAARDTDAEAYLDYFSKDDFISINSNYRQFETLSSWSNSVKQWYSNRETKKLDYSESQITVLSPNLVLATRVAFAENLLKGGKNEKVFVLTTELWEKEDSEWKVRHMHESVKSTFENQMQN